MRLRCRYWGPPRRRGTETIGGSGLSRGSLAARCEKWFPGPEARWLREVHTLGGDKGASSAGEEAASASLGRQPDLLCGVRGVPGVPVDEEVVGAGGEADDLSPEPVTAHADGQKGIDKHGHQDVSRHAMRQQPQLAGVLQGLAAGILGRHGALESERALAEHQQRGHESILQNDASKNGVPPTHTQELPQGQESLDGIQHQHRDDEAEQGHRPAAQTLEQQGQQQAEAAGEHHRRQDPEGVLAQDRAHVREDHCEGVDLVLEHHIEGEHKDDPSHDRGRRRPDATPGS
mmetsp:Transcript_71486/g.232318  ORF Transcript_71486/g.232318 Transcript_71486/m.232318 type:complete len:289 (-) Transcript_71486:1001-1867(-)